MRAIVMSTFGGPEVLTPGDLPDPVPAEGEVLVRVAAAGVNRADLLQRQGHYPPPPGASDTLGLEVSGTVAALGPGAEGWAVGDEVCALLSGGGYAELVVVPVGQLLPVPAGVDLVDAAGLPETVSTVVSNVLLTAGLRAGEVLLVHGGSSGIGTTAVQIAAALGARVAVTAGSAEKLARCAELGAEILVNYREQDFVAEVRTATEGHGADVVLDVVGAKYLGRNVEVLARGGRIVTIGMQGGVRGELDLGRLLAVNGSITATSLRSRPLDEKAEVVTAVRQIVWPLIAAGRVRPIIEARLPLEKAAEAHEILKASQHVGKVLLTL